METPRSHDHTIRLDVAYNTLLFLLIYFISLIYALFTRSK